MADRTVSVTLNARVAGYIAQMQAAGRATAEVGASGSKVAQQVGLISPKLMGVGVAAGFMAVTAVQKFATFDAAMSSVAASTRESASAMGELRDAAMKAGADTVYSASEAAGAIDNLAKAGVSTSDILGGGLSGALALAAAGQMDVADAAEATATAMNMFGLSGSDATHVADVLAAGAGKAMGEVSDMAMALKMSGLVASQFGWSLEETVGTLSAFAQQGLIGSDAGTSLKTMLLRLGAPTKEAQAEIERLGISTYDAAGQFIGAADLAAQLTTAMGALDPATRNASMSLIFGQDAIRGANVLFSEGQTGMNGWISGVNDAGYAAETAAKKVDNLKGDLEKLGGALDTLFIKTAGGANGPLRDLVQQLTNVVDAVGSADSALRNSALSRGGDAPGLIGIGSTGGVPTPGGFDWALDAINKEIEGYERLRKAKELNAGTFFSWSWAEQANSVLGTTDIPVTSPSMEAARSAALDAAAAADVLTDSQTALGSAAAILGIAEQGAAGAITEADQAMRDATGAAIGYLGAKLNLAGAGRDLIGLEGDLRAGMYSTTTAATTGSAKRTSMSKVERKELNDHIADLRKKDKAQEDAEVKAAQRRAKAAAEKRADAGARKDVQDGVKRAIDTDLAAKRGEDINGTNQGNSVGEATGSLTDQEQKSLDAKVKAIRDRHQKSLDAQVKGLQKSAQGADGAAKATSRASGATKTYSASLDENTVAGRHNLDMLDAKVAGFLAEAQQIADSTYEVTGSAQKASDAAEAYLLKVAAGLVESGTSAGFAKDDVEEYLASIDMVPGKVTTLFDVNTDPAEAAMAKLLKDWEKRYKAGWQITSPSSPVQPKPTTPTTTRPAQDPRTGVYRHSGGVVYGSGDVPITAKGGEYVVEAQQYAANRDLVRAVNNGTGRVSGGGGYTGPVIGALNFYGQTDPGAVRANVIDAQAEAAYRGGQVR